MCSRQTCCQTQPHERTDINQDKLQILLLIQRNRTETLTQHQIVWDQNRSTWKTMSVTNVVVVRLVALSGSEREIYPPRSQVYVFQLDRCRHELQQNTWAPLPKSLVVDSGAGETVMPVDWLTNHPLTESDGSIANDVLHNSLWKQSV